MVSVEVSAGRGYDEIMRAVRAKHAPARLLPLGVGPQAALRITLCRERCARSLQGKECYCLVTLQADRVRLQI